MTRAAVDEQWMSLALDEAGRAMRSGEWPFAALIINSEQKCIAVRPDTVERDDCFTSHAETLLVRDACKILGRDLTGCTVYTTVEPCPMCFTSCWLSRVSRIVFGATMAQAAAASGDGIRELAVPASQMNQLGGTLIEVVGGVLADRCAALFTDYRSNPLVQVTK